MVAGLHEAPKKKTNESHPEILVKSPGFPRTSHVQKLQSKAVFGPPGLVEQKSPFVLAKTHMPVASMYVLVKSPVLLVIRPSSNVIKRPIFYCMIFLSRSPMKCHGYSKSHVFPYFSTGFVGS